MTSPPRRPRLSLGSVQVDRADLARWEQAARRDGADSLSSWVRRTLDRAATLSATREEVIAVLRLHLAGGASLEELHAVLARLE